MGLGRSLLRNGLAARNNRSRFVFGPDALSSVLLDFGAVRSNSGQMTLLNSFCLSSNSSSFAGFKTVIQARGFVELLLKFPEELKRFFCTKFNEFLPVKRDFRAYLRELMKLLLLVE